MKAIRWIRKVRALWKLGLRPEMPLSWDGNLYFSKKNYGAQVVILGIGTRLDHWRYERNKKK